MNWALEEAKEIIKREPNKEEYVIASGVSPSGIIHIGNFREIVTTYFVGKELENLGKKVRFILSFDDFDRFRKVPAGIPESYNKYVGMPYTRIPSPFDKNKSYAQEMEDRFINELHRLNIYPETIYQTNQYNSGRYDKKIKLALDNRKDIFDIISKYKTQDFTDDDRNRYYPISLYCKNCGKDSTKILNYDEKNGKIEYECSCGYHHIQDIANSDNIKLHWKIDWPMRWQQENVIFEPGGKDHSAQNGSYVVSKEIAKKIFNYEAPSYLAYDFIGIKGGNGKMSSSKGNVLTLTDLLEVYDKNIILWFYAKNRPNHHFNIALDQDVLRAYAEYDRFVKAYYDNKLDDKNKSVITLTGVKSNYLNYPDFGYIANFLPMVGYNVDTLSKLLSKDGIDCTTIYFKSRLARAKCWLEKYNNSKVKILDKFNNDYYETLSVKEKNWLKKTIDILKNNYDNTQDLQKKLYDVVKKDDDDVKEIKKNQKRYFQIIYNMILGQDSGPKMSLLLSALDYDFINSRLNKHVNEKQLVKKFKKVISN